MKVMALKSKASPQIKTNTKMSWCFKIFSFFATILAVYKYITARP